MQSKTPYFESFGPLLFGRSPKSAVDELIGDRCLEKLSGLFKNLITKQAFARPEKGVNSRERELPPLVTFWAFVAQVLSVGCSCREIVRKVDAWWRLGSKRRQAEPLSASAYAQARIRLDKGTLGKIVHTLADNLESNTLREEVWLCGRSVKIIDGTTISMPDTEANQKAWPQTPSQKPGLGFPLMKLVGIFALSSGALLQHATGSFFVHEIPLFQQLWSYFKKGDVVLGDRGFCSYLTLAGLFQRGVDSVMRLHGMRKVDFRKGRRLGPDNRIVTWRRPHLYQCPKSWSREAFLALPKTIEVRIIRLQVAAKGYRTKTVVLATTLLDATLYPADAIRELYAQRWTVELHFHQIKTLLALDVLRCKSPEMIERELLIHLIAYNLVRVLMQRSAHLHQVAIQRLSFKGTLDTARHFADVIHAAAATPRLQQRLIDEMYAIIASDLLPIRPGRSEPRAKKRRPKNYQLLTKLRKSTGNLPRRNRPKKNVPKPA